MKERFKSLGAVGYIGRPPEAAVRSGTWFMVRSDGDDFGERWFSGHGTLYDRALRLAMALAEYRATDTAEDHYLERWVDGRREAWATFAGKAGMTIVDSAS
jgi:hypothetical protein